MFAKRHKKTHQKGGLWEIQTPNSILKTSTNSGILIKFINLGAYLGAYMPKTL
jgi:hypothetical protein